MIEPIEMNVDFSTQDTEMNVEADMNCRIEIPLPIAGATTLGGIKVGENLSITEDGTLSVDGSGTQEEIEQLQEDVDQLETALTTKAEQDGAYPDLIAGQLLSKNEASDSVPYNFRAVGHEATLEYTDAIVGGSVVANQLVQNGNFANADGWTCNFGTIVVVSNELTFTSNGSNVVGATYRNAVFASNHKVLVSFEAKGDFPHVRVRRPFQSADTVLGSTYRTYSFVGNVNGQDQVNLETVMIQGVLATAEASKTYSLKNVCAFDLTQMFGTAIADFLYSLGSEVGVAWLRKHFPKMFTYQPYNAGEIVSVQGLSQHVTTGFNQWDEEWINAGIDSDGTIYVAQNSICSKNYIRCIPNTDYFPYGVSNIAWYDGNMNFIRRENGDSIRTSPSNAVFFMVDRRSMQTYNHDICINLSDPTRNGEYEPYQKRTYPLDDSLTLRGILKLDSNNQLYADGDRYLPDGTVQRRYGVVDLGTLDWNYSSGRAYFSSTTALSNGKQTLNAISVIYPKKFTSWNAFTGYTDGNALYIDSGNPNVYIKNPSYTDSATFKAAMSGVYLVYELAEPTTEEADPYTVPQIVDPNGTEEYVSTSIVPVGHESRYPLDIAGRLDKILTMPTANGTYTLRATVNNGAVTYAWVST